MDKEVISEFERGARLDKALAAAFPDYSRSSLAKLIENNAVLVNKQPEKAGYKLRKGDTVTVNLSLLTKQPAAIDIPIVYEDSDVIVLNKPAGILTHSKGAFNPEATVATFIADKIRGMTGDRAGIVHRLDRATSGVIICAKTPQALQWLQKQFSQRKTKKTYLAVIEGRLNPEAAIIDMPIERDTARPKQFRVSTNGKPAKTHYTTLNSNDTYSTVELKPITGRTHQLRVHLKQLKHPIVGDELYGGKSYKRLLLHARSLEITLPSRERKIFSTPIPQVFKTIIK